MTIYVADVTIIVRGKLGAALTTPRSSELISGVSG